MGTLGKKWGPVLGVTALPAIQQNKRLRFIGFCPYTYPGAGGQYESENISGCVARRVTKISGIVAGVEPGPCTEELRPLTKGK